MFPISNSNNLRNTRDTEVIHLRQCKEQGGVNARNLSPPFSFFPTNPNLPFFSLFHSQLLIHLSHNTPFPPSFILSATPTVFPKPTSVSPSSSPPVLFPITEHVISSLLDYSVPKPHSKHGLLLNP